MKFSTQVTYGLRAMIRLADDSGSESMPISSIAKAEDISQKYLERLFSKLKKADLVKSEQGSSGGYKLARKPSQINVFEVINALEGEISPFHCSSVKGKVYCSSKCNCGVTLVLYKIQESIGETLKNIKLSDLPK